MGAPAGGSTSAWRLRGDPLVAGADIGVLRGHTVAVKDTYAVAGHAVGAGNPTWLAQAPREHRSAAAVQGLLEAGADVAGIAHTSEFAYDLSGVNAHYGTPPNPAAEGCVPGGSTSGPASAVASRAADIGLGSDTAGSIRVPASYCALFGMRVTHGAVSTEGLLPLASTFDAVGWLTRDAETLARVASVLLPETDTTGPGRLVLATDLFELADPSVQSALVAPSERLVAELGCPADRVPAFDADRVDDIVEAFITVQAAQAWQAHGHWIDTHLGSLGPQVRRRFEVGRSIGAEQRQEAERVLVRASAVLDEVVRPGTLLVQPAAGTPAPPLGMPASGIGALRTRTIGLTCAASLAGLPVVTVPAGSVDGRPVGLSLVGARGTDRMLAEAARVVG